MFPIGRPEGVRGLVSVLRAMFAGPRSMGCWQTVALGNASCRRGATGHRGPSDAADEGGTV